MGNLFIKKPYCRKRVFEKIDDTRKKLVGYQYPDKFIKEDLDIIYEEEHREYRGKYGNRVKWNVYIQGKWAFDWYEYWHDCALFPKYANIDHSWDNVNTPDVDEIMFEADKYADPLTVLHMTLEETLKLIEEHNPSFAKAMREELAAEKARYGGK